MLETNLDWYRGLLAAASAVVLIAGISVAAVPSPPSHAADVTDPFKNLARLKDDRLFRRFTISWFLLGFSNLWTVPLRVVYLDEADRGLGLSPLVVMLIGGVIP